MHSLTPAPVAASTPDHIPAHVKNSYVNCEGYGRRPRLTPAPERTAGR
ncbi:hypothetical protein ACFQY4_14180 [Catellatospora bangladeshensis]|uniref:Uncharacterized protein n=1 Tax=Catellatospora bangladeshensis TaxID=310355 RepID=A0A8J3NMC4_9ACTN|nr:hypothetical protein [Catellatospora bangladeshensis]GIF83525.1 hypothetical protein Cba03nite_48740 [Catellatospora bangladeshensis]